MPEIGDDEWFEREGRPQLSKELFERVALSEYFIEFLTLPAYDYLVYTVEERDRKTVAKAIEIRPGPLAGNQVSILDGLREGQRIVASGANLLRPGDVVKEVP